MVGNDLERRLLVLVEEKVPSIGRRVWNESKLIWTIAFPAIISRLTSFGAFLVTMSYVGHISQVELAGFALVQTILSQFALGLLTGMSSATETLCGQAFGANQHHMLGIYMQRSWVIEGVTATILLPFFMFASQLFKLLGEEDDVADAAGQISVWVIGINYVFVFSFTIQMFLQAQRKNMILAIISPICFTFHFLVTWIFVAKLGWGVNGAMSALVLSRSCVIVLLAIYVFGGWCRNSWTGFSRQAFHDIKPIIKLSISSGVMTCVSMWYTSILVFLAAYTTDATVNISAFSICIVINSLQTMICLGFMISTSVRVSNEIGKGDAMAAKFSIKLILAISVTFGLLFCVLCLVFGREIPYIFTSDNKVAEVASKLSTPLAITMLLNSIQTVFSGVAIGTGSQAKVAVINICSYYLIGIPIGCVLAYAVGYGIMGIWIGLISGLATRLVVLGCVTWRIDWTAEVEKTTQRLSRFFLDQNEESK